MVCSSCKNDLNIRLFFKSKSNKRGYQSECRLCTSKRKALKQKKDRDSLIPPSCIWMPKREDVLIFLKIGEYKEEAKVKKVTKKPNPPKPKNKPIKVTKVKEDLSDLTHIGIEYKSLYDCLDDIYSRR